MSNYILYQFIYLLTAAVDDNVASVIGYEETGNRVYGYGQDQTTIFVSNDNGVTWGASRPSYLAADRLLTWTEAMQVPETLDGNLIIGSPHASYQQFSWGGNILRTYILL